MKDSLREQETENIMKLLFPDIPLSTKKVAAEELKLPEIGKDTQKLPAATNTTSQVEQDNINLLSELTQLQNSVQDLERETRLQQLKDQVHEEVSDILHSVQKELEDLKERKIPRIKKVDTGGTYREHLYPIAVNLLNKILLPLINQIPEYSLIATQITDTYDDGTIKNAVVVINIRLLYNDFVFDFKVEVVVLNGFMHYPTYVTRGRRMIALTQEDLYQELETQSFRPVDIVTKYRGNPFSNIGENPHRKRDSQKFYNTMNTTPLEVGLSDTSRWVTHKHRNI